MRAPTDMPRGPQARTSGDGARTLALLFWMVPLSILRAWVFSVLWRWFVIPITGWDPISVAAAFGLMTTVGLCQALRPDDDRPSVALLVTFSVTISLTALGMGWVALQVSP